MYLTKRLRTRAPFFLKLAIGLVLIAALLSRMDFTAIVAAIQRYSLLSLLGTTALTLFSYLVASARWKVLVPEVPYGRLLRYSLIGQFYSLVLPGQIAGEAVKAWRISRGAADGPKLVASVMIDRVLGLIALLVVATWGIVVTRSSLSRSLLFPVVALTTLLILGLFALASSRAYKIVGRAMEFFRVTHSRLNHIIGQILMLITAWRSYTQTPARLFGAFLLGVLFQLLAVAVFAWLANDLGIHLDVHHWMWIVGITSIAVLLPLSIGGIGLREGALIALLAEFGVPGESAIALSLGVFFLMLIAAVAGWIADTTDRRSTNAA